MQIVIDIPEKMYHMINAGFYDYGDMNVIIQNGTPLDNIRSEIAEEHNDCMVTEQYDTAYGLELALGIIDKYKGESEE